MKYLILLLLPFSAQAVTFSWTPPDPVIGAETVGYNINCGAVRGIYTDTILVNDGAATSHTAPFPDGVQYCAMQTIGVNGTVSGFSDEVACTVVGDSCSGPNAPGGLIVQ